MELTALRLLLLPLLLAAPLAAAETVLGAYIFHRHGDRTTKSYKPVSLTALGAEQVFASGTYYRNRYVASDAQTRIQGIAPDVAVLSQLSVTSPVDDVLQHSAQVFLQGLYPPAGAASVQTLANGSRTEPPLGGYVYVPVNAVSTAASSGGSENSEWLQGGSGCANAVVSSNNYFASREYLDTLASTKDFYHGLLPVVNSTFSDSQATFKNAYTIFDYVHVSTIHNQTIPAADLLTNETLHQLQTRADQHEWGLAYNSSEPVRAIAGAVLAGQILQALNDTLRAPVASATAQRLTIQFGAYAAFMSFFGLANATAASPDFYGIVDYASNFVLELVTNATTPSSGALDPADASVRFLFVNGTVGDNNPPRVYPLFGRSDALIPWSDFAAEMGRFAIADTASWCRACGNSTGVCATALGNDGGDSGNSSAAGTSSTSHKGSGGMSRAVAGVVGAMVTLAVVLGLEALVLAVGGLRLVKKGNVAGKQASSPVGPSVTQA
ncbi:hypothetical protein VTK73DRAFT_5643 [Phialemonium thermophilum]|uniref:Histidine acid phosphatase n=1 Tax=Phialemonium thermophilum TaxID=223376 RepID=A0ABR3WMB4_9PEZI